MNLKRNKKGFTIVELVIVIAVIAVLAAVLIPTFVSLVHKAQVSADQSLVKNLNTALAMEKEEKGSKSTMYDTLVAMENRGFVVDRLTPTSADNDIVWDSKNDQFVLVMNKEGKYFTGTNTESTYKTFSNKDFINLWKISNSVDSKYSTYYTGENVPIETDKGFDAGKSDLTSINYSNNGDKQEVVIRTNGGNLTINAKNDTVNHYGEGLVLDIQAIADASYHENGYFPKASIAKGRLVVEETGEVPAIEVPANATGEVAIENKGEVSTVNVGATSQNVSIDNKGKMDSVDTVLAEGTVTIANTGKIENAVVNASANLSGITEDKKTEVSSAIAYTSGDIATAGYYYLTTDISNTLKITATNGEVIINGNGHTIRTIEDGAALQYNDAKIDYDGVEIATNSPVSLKNTKIYSGKGVRLTTATQFDVKIDNLEIYAAHHGINFGSRNSNSKLVVSNSLIQNMSNPNTNKFEAYDYETIVGKALSDGYSRGISVWQSDKAEITIDKSVLKGFYYEINTTVANDGDLIVNNNLNVTVIDSELIGRDGLNVWSANSNYTIENSRIKGINVYLGNSEDFANIVNNNATGAGYNAATGNVYTFKDCSFEIYRAPATGTNGQHVIDLREGENKVKLIGNNTVVAEVYFNTDSAYYPTSGDNLGAMIILQNKDQLEGQFASATMNCYKASEKNTFKWTEIQFPNVLYYADGWEEYQDFSKLFENGWFMNGEHAKLQNDIVLKQNLPSSNGLKSGETIYIEFDSYNISGGTITLDSGRICITDKLVDGLFVNSDGSIVAAVDNGNGTFSYIGN